MSSAGPQEQPAEMLVDLLIKELTEGLSAAEQAQLWTLNGPRQRFRGQFERAIAAVNLAGTPPRSESPPQALRERIERQGQAFLAGQLAAGGVTTLQPAPSAASIHAARVPRARRGSGRRSVPARRFGAAGRPAAARFAAAGWIAAAACLMVAMVGWLRTPRPPAAINADLQANAGRLSMPPAPPRARPEAPSPAEQRAALLAQVTSVTMTLQPTQDQAAAGVSADVVWDGATQSGFIRFVGLRRNDPRVSQYQAWIFDGQRDKRYPVDAGVFNVEADAAPVIVPIHAALPIGSPKAFAVTVEQPGGVVVSALRHVVVLGSAT